MATPVCVAPLIIVVPKVVKLVGPTVSDGDGDGDVLVMLIPDGTICSEGKRWLL